MRHIDGVKALTALVGHRLGESDWVTIDQAAIDAYADISFDHNWIHVDPVRAADTTFRGTIAHGGLCLAVVGGKQQEIFVVDGLRLALAYGFEKVRFPQAVEVDSRIRVVVDLAEVRQNQNTDAVDALWHNVVEIDGLDKPACVADMLIRYFPASN
ncbi:MaoC family dehydratase [Rhodococcus sp. BP-149]|uniref:MaoC family dehydratase n=1 Tax=unclassified Rhodococcus (in: high G+C Gram-positive bacteria) TaxID=192944 RepID=UPI001C9A78BA|nr:MULTISPECIES: MaoC family dehydratase [unclassified Rhodococcus (in: high G+C Gram-positive bacteria)]MBY6687741.1 MaoC family dehydratase [Rhodococcus sp. BP-288]MBY6696006.1 MaoC family dehydratase [Rhodococcus sp. BP-188]MBY6700603.1 MaoC family dehydratase [Rhodococcus sp. BP-285]MBY6705000.1 MaoC family dehydratase [Rhodococcus sp. BP-283]MBY6708586.1 MaoC family dehydratase [Rhodococcus sp. BP-241]